MDRPRRPGGRAPSFDNRAVAVDTTKYGAGSGGFVPVLTALNPATAGQALNLSVTEAVGGGSMFLFVGLGKASLPLGPGGCELLVSPTPILLQTPAIPMGGAGAGNGSVQLGGVLPSNTSGLSFNLQAFVIDAGVAAGFSNTNGLEIKVP